jgi:general secretion pathway protein I
LTILRARGFTLLEVLIALAILAVSAAAVLRQTQLGVQQQQQLELKSYALWLADDTVADIAAKPQWPALGRSTRRTKLRDQQWEITTEVQSTDAADIRRIEVSVRLADSPEGSALVAFTTYRGQY